MANADHTATASPVLHTGEIAAVGPKFAEGYARIREVTDNDGACPAWTKALFMSAAAAVRDHDAMCRREMQRSVRLGLTSTAAGGAALAVLISRGEAVYERFRAAADDALGEPRPSGDPSTPPFNIDRQGALDYFQDYFGFVPDYIELMANDAPRGLEGNGTRGSSNTGSHNNSDVARDPRARARSPLRCAPPMYISCQNVFKILNPHLGNFEHIQIGFDVSGSYLIVLLGVLHFNFVLGCISFLWP